MDQTTSILSDLKDNDPQLFKEYKFALAADLPNRRIRVQFTGFIA